MVLFDNLYQRFNSFESKYQSKLGIIYTFVSAFGIGLQGIFIKLLM